MATLWALKGWRALGYRTFSVLSCSNQGVADVLHWGAGLRGIAQRSSSIDSRQPSIIISHCCWCIFLCNTVLEGHNSPCPLLQKQSSKNKKRGYTPCSQAQTPHCRVSSIFTVQKWRWYHRSCLPSWAKGH